MELIPDFRCERCGYDLSVIAADGLCQECGTPVDDSRPERRPGVPWQHRATFVNWLRTTVTFTMHPFRTFREVRIESRSMRRLASLNLLTSFCLSALAFAGSLVAGRQAVTLSGGGITHIIVDGSPMMLLFINLLLGVISFPVFRWGANWYASRAKPPRHGAVMWVSAGLTSGAFVVGTGITIALWGLRATITPTVPIQVPAATAIYSSSEFRFWNIVFTLPSLFYLVFLIAFAAIDYFANRPNRLANSLDPRP